MKGSVLMNQKVIIRNEEQKDRAVVEQITRQAFYNLYNIESALARADIICLLNKAFSSIR